MDEYKELQIDQDDLINFFKKTWLTVYDEIKNEKNCIAVFLNKRTQIINDTLFEFVTNDNNYDIYFKSFNGAKEELKEIYKTKFLNTASFMAIFRDLLLTDCQDIELPKIILVTDLSLHGRTINHFLYEIKQELFNASKNYQKEEREKLLNELKEKAEISIYKKNKDKQLLSTWNKNITNAYHITNKKGIYRKAIELASWINMNGQISFVSYNNQESKKTANNKTVLGPFKHYHTEIDNIPMDSYIRAYPSNEKCKAVLTMRKRIRYNKEKGQEEVLITPDTILNDFSWIDSLELHKQIISDCKSAGNELLELLTTHDRNITGNEECDYAYFSYINKLNILILNVLLTKDYLYHVEKADKKEQEKWFDFLLSFPLMHEFGTQFTNSNKMMIALRQLWNWADNNKLEKYLGILLKNTSTLTSQASLHNQENIDDDVINIVKDTISQIGYNGEKEANYIFSSKASLGEETLSKCGAHDSISTFFKKCEERRKTYIDAEQKQIKYLQKIEKKCGIDLEKVPKKFMAKINQEITIEEAVAVLLHYVECGHLEITPVYERPPASDNYEYFKQAKRCYTEILPNINAISILPLQYYNLLDTLEDISFYGNDYDNAFADIRLFCNYLITHSGECEPLMTELTSFEKLKEFYKNVIDAGWTFKDLQTKMYPTRLDFLKDEQSKIKYRSIRRKI